MRSTVRFLVILSLFTLASFACRDKVTKVWLIGDSTMSVKDRSAYPETGWGMPFAHFFDSSVAVENCARNGRSTRSFMAEGLWQPVVSSLNPGDYVFIQFGHNDEGKQKVERYTTPAQFRDNLKKYVQDSRDRNAIPVLITPVARRKFDSTGNVVPSHPVYSDAVRDVARELAVPLIDLDAKSQQLLQQMGPEGSRHLFLQLAPGEHPNYPEGKMDNTHFSELGARKMATIVLAEIRSLRLSLADRIVSPPVKKN